MSDDLNIEKKPRLNYNDDVKKLIKLFGIDDKNIIMVKGSYSNPHLYYYGDYDLYVNFKGTYSRKELYEKFCVILRNITENTNTYFIELKIQQLNGDKIKWYPNEYFNFSDFDKAFNYKTEYIKIDIVYYSPINNDFTEASCNYHFNEKNNDVDNTIDDVNNEIKELKKNHNYYKVLKRLYIIYLINGDKNKIEILNKFFNSNYGLIYKQLADIQAIILVKKYYNDSYTKKRIEVNLNNMKYPINYKSLFNTNIKLLNKEALHVYKNINIK